MSDVEDATAYHDAGYAVLRSAVNPDVVEHLVTYANTLMAAQELEFDPQVPGSWKAYGTAGFDALLQSLTSAVNAATGVTLLPTYSYLRVYMRGQELVPHRDRSECQHSATVHLASASGRSWPIGLRRGSNSPLDVSLHAGDLLVYRGDELMHWRDPLEDDWYMQVFLHWVDADGPFAGAVFDKRPSLGRGSIERVNP